MSELKAAVIYESATKKPLMVVTNITEESLNDPAFNTEGTQKFVIPMSEYAKTNNVHDDVHALAARVGEASA